MSNELINSTLPSIQEWSTIKEQVGVYLRSGFLPSSVKTSEQAITIAMKGRELGVPPLQAFAHINIVQGKPVISSELMLALIYKNCPEADIAFENKDDACLVTASRGRGKPISKFVFTMDDAKQAGLVGKDNWKKHPQSMLRARVVAAMARAIFPDCIMGCSYTPEEIGADIDENGEIIDSVLDTNQPTPISHIEIKQALPEYVPTTDADYVVEAGSLRGMRLGDLQQHEVEAALNRAYVSSKEPNFKATKEEYNFVTHARRHLKSKENNK